jgi:hypothetical protein
MLNKDFKYEYIETHEELIKIIQECEGKHTQQVCYSTFHNCLTQIDWTDKIIRSNLRI